ncbi:MAG: hypothetical protein QME46_11435 [Thermoanaerobacteraceae bacterium]|nr:hypothetical protein [Thermoanaerobacteraceae bacterium]
MRDLWNKETERQFFIDSIKFATHEQLFYITDSGKYLAYWPNGYTGKKSTLQSRNSLIGNYTEKWTADLIQEIVDDLGYYAVQGAICEEIALTDRSRGDVVISKSKNIYQRAEDILAIFEVKMSIVWNWEYEKSNSNVSLKCIGDYKTHQGNPGLLRSDSMLKAIGKSLNIRVSNIKSSKIPIFVIGNTPITNNYISKVDQLKISGVIQGFLSVNSKPLDNGSDNIKATPKNGFYRFDSFDEIKNYIHEMLMEEMNYFSGMKSNLELGEIIEIANREPTYEKKAEKFLDLVRK